MKQYKMPENFLWGAATAGHQVEGNNVNSESWILEHLPETIYKEPSGDACDHYHRYREDIKLLAGLGLNAYRFSIEWARIEPAEGEFSQAALNHYRRMLEACHDNGITPVVTLHHFISPQWLTRKGGWLSQETPDLYARYVGNVVEHMGDLMGTVCTFNEPNIARILDSIMPFKVNEGPFWESAAAAFGVEPENLGLFQFVADRKMWEIVYEAHCKARKVLKEHYPGLSVGLTLALLDVQAVNGGEEKAAELRRYMSGEFLDRLDEEDFIGVQTYSRMLVGPEGIVPPPEGAEMNQMGEEYYPEAIGGTIRYTWESARVPVIVTENGLSTEDDSRRLEYYERALKSVAACMEDGIDVKGYFAWSAMDNFEWVSGYEPKFGIIAIDRQTLERQVKPSGKFLGEVARKNSILV